MTLRLPFVELVVPKHFTSGLLRGWVALFVLLLSSELGAQPPSDTPAVSGDAMMPRASEAAEEPGVQKADLTTYYLRDEDGQLVAVLAGFTYEEFLQLYDLSRNLSRPDQPPRYTIQEIDVRGTAQQDKVQLEATFVLNVPREVEGWVRIPLGLGKAMLTEPVEHEGRGKFFTQFDQAEQTYVAWLYLPALPPLANRRIPNRRIPNRRLARRARSSEAARRASRPTAVPRRQTAAAGVRHGTTPRPRPPLPRPQLARTAHPPTRQRGRSRRTPPRPKSGPTPTPPKPPRMPARWMCTG